MNEWGESPAIYVWPEGHKEGTAYPDDFWDRLGQALSSVGIDWETF